MKRVISILLATILIVALFSGCASEKASDNGGNGSKTESVTTGLGIVTGIGSSASATAEKAGNAQVDSIIAVVTLDSNGKITKCSLDAAQTRVGFDQAGVVTADKAAAIQTKVEKGEGYGMKKNSAIGKEWNEQAAAFAAWAVGKTIDEVKNLKTKKVDDNHTAVPDVADLTSSVSIDVGEFKEAIEKAGANAKSASVSGTYKTGLGVVTSIKSSKDATAEAAGVGQVDSMIAAVTVDANGKIVACSIDSAQTRVNFDAAGQLTSDLAAEIKSKLELGDAYGMKKNSGIGKEWFEQINAFAAWTIGKTVDEVKGLKTKQVDDNHPAVPDIADLTSSVTITVGDYIAAVEKAVANAK